MKLDPAKRDASLPSVEGLDEKAAAKALASGSGSSSSGREKVDEIKARIGDMSPEELDALDSDDRKGVQDALAAERERRAAASE